MHPFQELKVIELASVLAGPSVGLFFAELGARVIKIENPSTGGDVTRLWKAASEDKNNPKSAYYHSVNWNKEVQFKNLKNATDRKLVYELISTADIVICNYRKGASERLGMDYERLSAKNPKLIYANITAYGDDDDRPGFDALLQAKTGWMSMNGSPDGPPVKLPVAIVDVFAAHQLKEGILVALWQRERTGKGGKVSVSLFDSSVAALTNQAANWLNLNLIPQRIGSRHPNIAPYGDVLIGKDGKGMLLATGTEKHFLRLCEVLDLLEIAKDKRFRTNLDRLQNRDALYTLLQSAFSKKNLEEWVLAFAKAEIPSSPILNLKQVFDLPEANPLLLSQKEEDGSISWRVKTAVFKIDEYSNNL